RARAVLRLRAERHDLRVGGERGQRAGGDPGRALDLRGRPARERVEPDDRAERPLGDRVPHRQAERLSLGEVPRRRDCERLARRLARLRGEVVSRAVPYLVGADGCRGGWITAERNGRGAIAWSRVERLEVLFERANGPDVLAVDAPIGLLER